MRVSVICPTYERQSRHENLYRAFAHQTHPDKELLILDDSPQASPFFTALEDKRVKYHFLPVRMSIGYKRNFLASLASGEIIAHFDDDDYYAPTYLAEMLLKLENIDLVKLSRWFALRESDGSLWEWDTRFIADTHFVISGGFEIFHYVGLAKRSHAEQAQFIDHTLWGFGFSYVYRKSLWQDCPFADMDFGEDYHFIYNARMSAKVLSHTPEFPHLVLHTIHLNSSSKIFPQYRLNVAEGLASLGDAVAPWLVG